MDQNDKQEIINETAKQLKRSLLVGGWFKDSLSPMRCKCGVYQFTSFEGRVPPVLNGKDISTELTPEDISELEKSEGFQTTTSWVCPCSENYSFEIRYTPREGLKYIPIEAMVEENQRKTRGLPNR